MIFTRRLLIVSLIALALASCKRQVSADGMPTEKPTATESSTASESPEPPFEFEAEPAGPVVRSLSAGSHHTCAVTDEGRLLCWGAIGSDALIDAGVLAPTPIGEESDWAEVDAGWGSVCALKTDGSAWCFATHNGSPASNRKALDPVPLRLGSATNWTSLATDAWGACGIRDDKAYCISRRDLLGRQEFDREVTDEFVKEVEGLAVRSISPGQWTTCATTTTGELWCWGRVGRTREKAPVRIGTRADWHRVEMGGLSGCASVEDGKLYCWEKDPNEAKQVGVEPTSDTADGFTAGDDHACAPTTSGWQCWGDVSAAQRGDAQAEAPSPVEQATDWTTLTAGGRHTCGVHDQHVYCWGDNGFGQLGSGEDASMRATPVPLDTDQVFTAISATIFHACGLNEAGKLYCWGENGTGEFDPQLPSAARPTPVLADQEWVDISVSPAGNCAIRADGTLWCFGYEAPRQMTQYDDWKDIELGDSRSCATRTDGSLWCWLGSGRRAPPTKLVDSGWSDLSVSYKSVCGTLPDKTARCIQFKSPKQKPWEPVPNQGQWTTFETGGFAACGIREDGSGWCVDPFEGERPSPFYSAPKLEPLTGETEARWANLSIGPGHACAIRQDGSLWCWGSDQTGALGLGPDTLRASGPQQVGEDTWSTVSLDDNSTCGITTDGVPHCWGRHYVIGDGRWLKRRPQPVAAPASGSN